MNQVFWVVAIIVLQAVVAAIAKKAQANAEAARIARSSGGQAPPTAGAEAPAASKTVVRTPNGARSSGSASGAKRPRKPKSIATGATPQPRAAAPQTPAPVAVRGGDSSDALRSRQHVAASVAKVKAVEARVAEGLANVELARAVAKAPPAPSVAGADLARILRNPQQVRQALIVGEILGKPRSMTA
jgi:hypothetical protein